MKKSTVVLTSPWQFGVEISRCIFNWEKVWEILIYWTRRQLLNLLSKSFDEETTIKLWQKLSIQDHLSQQDFPNWVFPDPFFSIWGNIFDTVSKIPLIFTINPNKITLWKVVIIWQNMNWISAEFERYTWEESCVKSIAPYISSKAILVSITKWISKEEIPLHKFTNDKRPWALTATQELSRLLNEKNLIALAWPSSASSLAQAAQKPSLHRFFFNIANPDETTRKHLIELLNPKIVWVKETQDVLATELLWACKNVFAFATWILEWYWISDETISLFQTLVQANLKKIFKKIWLNKKLVNKSPAWMGDFLLTCKKWRNGEWWRIVGKLLKKIKWKNLTPNQIKTEIKEKLDEYWKTVEWYNAASGLAQKLIQLWANKNDIILINRLVDLINGKIEFEKIYKFILRWIEYPI